MGTDTHITLVAGVLAVLLSVSVAGSAVAGQRQGRSSKQDWAERVAESLCSRIAGVMGRGTFAQSYGERGTGRSKRARSSRRWAGTRRYGSKRALRSCVRQQKPVAAQIRADAVDACRVERKADRSAFARKYGKG